MKIYSVPVLGGAYKGKDISDRTLLEHAVSDESFTFGKLSRDAGEAFCKKNLPGLSDDTFHWSEDATKINCPRCCEIIKRIGEK